MSQDGFYKEAASILEAVRMGKGRIKSLCYNSRHRNKQGLYALVSNVLKQYDLLEQTLDKAAFFRLEKHTIRPALAMVLLYDLLHGHSPQCSTGLYGPIDRNKTRLRGEYVKLKIKLEPPPPEVKPWRYARINRNFTTQADCVVELGQSGFNFSGEQTKPVDTKSFTLDPCISDLLVFWPGTDLTKVQAYKEGRLVLQDKASCMPVEVLKPPPGAIVLDTCAAPGNKTTQLAAAVGQKGKVYAFERDPMRAEILRTTLAKYTLPGTVEAINCDFLQTNPIDYPKVEFALVDPSCSGSGILEQHEISRETKAGSATAERLVSLANFQCTIIRHVMKCIGDLQVPFRRPNPTIVVVPNLKKIVYSTCSVHREENEQVVEQILKVEPGFILAKNPLPQWPRRGLEEYPFCTFSFVLRYGANFSTSPRCD